MPAAAPSPLQWRTGAKLHAVEGEAAAHGGKWQKQERGTRPGARQYGASRSGDAPLTAYGAADRFDAVLLSRRRGRRPERRRRPSRPQVSISRSMSPATRRSFARDCAALIDGGFRLERLLPIDQFPLVGASGAGGRVSAVEDLRSVEYRLSLSLAGMNEGRGTSRPTRTARDGAADGPRSTIAIMASPRDGADADAGVVAALGGDLGVFAGDIDGCDGGVRIELVGLDRRANHDVLARGDAAQYAAGIGWRSKVRRHCSMRISSALASPVSAAAVKPAADLHAFTALMLIMALARSASSLP